jgi:hypothetical protein
VKLRALFVLITSFVTKTEVRLFQENLKTKERTNATSRGTVLLLHVHEFPNILFQISGLSRNSDILVKKPEDITIICVGVSGKIILKCRMLSFGLYSASLWYGPLVGSVKAL